MRETTLITATSRRPTIPDVTVSASLRLCPDCAPTLSPFPRIATVSLALCLPLAFSHSLPQPRATVLGCRKFQTRRYNFRRDQGRSLLPDARFYATGSLINNSWHSKGEKGESYGSPRLRFTGSSCRTSDNCLPLHARKNKTDRCRVVGNFKHARLTLPQLRSERSINGAIWTLSRALGIQ